MISSESRISRPTTYQCQVDGSSGHWPNTCSPKLFPSRQILRVGDDVGQPLISLMSLLRYVLRNSFAKPSIWKAHPDRRRVGDRLARQYPTLLQVVAVQHLIMAQVDLACFERAHTRPACAALTRMWRLQSGAQHRIE